MKRVYVDISRCMACKTCELACSTGHSPVRRSGIPITMDLYSAAAEARESHRRIHLLNVSSGYYPNITMPFQCRHCENPPCMAGCMVDAIYKSDGRVLVNLDKCIGCRMCMMLCPYGAIDFIADIGKVVKCDLCPDEPEPLCVSSCPTKALMYLDDEELLEVKRRRLAESIQKTITTGSPTIVALG